MKAVGPSGRKGWNKGEELILGPSKDKFPVVYTVYCLNDPFPHSFLKSEPHICSGGHHSEKDYIISFRKNCESFKQIK